MCLGTVFVTFPLQIVQTASNADTLKSFGNFEASGIKTLHQSSKYLFSFCFFLSLVRKAHVRAIWCARLFMCVCVCGGGV